MKKQLRFEIDAETVTVIERFHYEYKSHENIMVTLLNSHSADKTTDFMDSPVYKRHKEDTVKALAAYESAKQEFEKTFPDRGIPAGEWFMDFTTRTLYITPAENSCTAGTCECKRIPEPRQSHDEYVPNHDCEDDKPLEGGSESIDDEDTQEPGYENDCSDDKPLEGGSESIDDEDDCNCGSPCEDDKPKRCNPPDPNSVATFFDGIKDKMPMRDEVRFNK